MKRYILFAAINIIISVSCEKIIDEKIAVKDPKLVLNAFLNPDSLFAVSVTQSISVLSKDTFIYVTDAKVKIYENNTFIEELQYDQNLNIYKSTINRPIPERNYQVEVSKNGFMTATAETFIPKPVQITSVDTFSRQNKSEFYEYPFVKVFKTTLTDPANEENFYIISLEKTEYSVRYKDTFVSRCFLMINSPIIELLGDNLNFYYWRAQNDDGISISNDNYLMATYFALSDKTFNGKSVSFEFELQNSSKIYPSDSITYKMILYTVNREYFSYINSESLYSPEGDPFAEPVTVFSNVKGGYGIVLGGSNTFITISDLK